ncbi:MAG: HDIG domain-containing metalloprotein [Thermotogota bacterium]
MKRKKKLKEEVLKEKPQNLESIIIRMLIFAILSFIVEFIIWRRLSFDFQVKFNIVFQTYWFFIVELYIKKKKMFQLHPTNYWAAFMIPLVSAILLNAFIYKYVSVYTVTALLTTMLITMLIDFDIGILSSLSFSLFFGIIYGFDITYMMIIFLPSTFVAWVSKKIIRRIEIFLPFIISSVLQIGLMVVFSYTRDTNQLLSIFLINFFTMLISMGILPFFEYITRVYSDLGLLELGNLNHPVLKKMTLHAAGTYYHSMIISNIAESATEHIKGNSILARVGSYFHDIGKTWRPQFFTENQKGVNPHNNISPKMSSLILDNHVNYGKQMAKEHRLPILIEDMIVQHQGTRIKQFFYKKYYDETGIQNTDLFKYPGPIPQFKESAILMICDVTEAITRSMKDYNASDLNEKLDDLIESLFFEGQLDDAGLSLRELQMIKGKIIRTIMEMNHKRIKYPKIDSKELKR